MYMQDPRFNLVLDDGLDYVKNCQENSFDVVVVDCTDPCGPSLSLFSEEFYSECKRILSKDGVAIT